MQAVRSAAEGKAQCATSKDASFSFCASYPGRRVEDSRACAFPKSGDGAHYLDAQPEAIPLATADKELVAVPLGLPIADVLASCNAEDPAGAGDGIEDDIETNFEHHCSHRT